VGVNLGRCTDDQFAFYGIDAFRGFAVQAINN